MKPLVVSVLAIFLFGGGVGSAHAQNLGNSLRIERLEFPVTLLEPTSDGGYNPISCTVVGYLYYVGTLTNRILQVAVHGATYNHTYWDFPDVNGRSYSYARHMAARGFAVLAIDQVGAGESCHPDGITVVHLQNTAGALAQILGSLRTTANPTGQAFGRIALVGHSAGSINAIAVQAATHLADALVVTAARHIAAPPLPPGVQAVMPFVGTLMTLPYFKLGALDVTIRQHIFYYAPSADPAVIAVDNATEDFWTGGQVGSTFFAFVQPFLGLPPIDNVQGVSGPVLIQLGEYDALFPASGATEEAAQWTHPGVNLEVQTISEIGHNFNLHLNRDRSWEGIGRWLRRMLP